MRPSYLDAGSRSARGADHGLFIFLNGALPCLGCTGAPHALKPAAAAVNAPQKVTFKCKLAKGKYKFSVTVIDAAGNPSSTTAVNKLTVK